MNRYNLSRHAWRRSKTTVTRQLTNRPICSHGNSLTQIKHHSISASKTYSLFEQYKQLFPHDTKTLGYMKSYKRITSHPPGSTDNYVVIGLVNGTRTRFLEALVADPLAANSKIWLDALEKRDTSANNLLVHTEKDLYEPSRDAYAIPSPVLSAQHRPCFQKAMPPLQPINIRLMEVNESNEIEDVDFYIHVVGHTLEEAPPQIADNVILRVIDNTDYTPNSSETTPYEPRHTIKVDSSIIYKGIRDFLQYDVAKSSEYFSAVQKSNILEAHKAVAWVSSADNIAAWLMQRIRARLADTRSVSEIKQTIEDIETNEVASFSEAAHSELQSSFIPETTRFFRRFAWWSLYYRNDNVEYDINEYFRSHFMNDSVERYAYTQGQIDQRLSSSPTGIKNPILELKEKTMQKVTDEIQPSVNRVLIEGLAYYQAPIVALAALGHLHFGLDLNTAVAIGLLGITVGFNHVSKEWTRTINNWLEALFEDTRLCLSRCVEKGLLCELSSKYEHEVERVEKRERIARDLDQDQKKGTTE